MARYLATATVELSADDLDDLVEASEWLWEYSHVSSEESELQELADRLDRMHQAFRRALR